MRQVLRGWGVMVLMLFGAFGARAQGLNADGRDYYIGLLYPSFNSQQIDGSLGDVKQYFRVSLLISSYSDNNVITVSYFDDNGTEGSVTTYNVMAHRAIDVPLDVSRMSMAGASGIAHYRTCHVTAKNSVNVQYFSTGSCSGGSYLAIPTNVLGKTYVVESYHDNGGGIGGDASNEDAAGQFLIVAPFDGTTVSVTPTATTKNNVGGVNCGVGSNGKPQSFTISLNRGQCYLVESTGTQSECDISGSTIVSNKPVAVIAGHENAITDGSDSQPIENGRLEARDFMCEEMIPVEYWDSTGYVSIPFLDSGLPAKDGFGDEYRAFAGIVPELGQTTPDHADIAMSGTSHVFPGTHAYASPAPHVTSVTTPVHIHSTNGAKIHVAMYDQRMQGSLNPFPCPSQMSLIPMSLWKTTYLFDVPNVSSALLQGYYINLICSRGDLGAGNILVAINGSTPANISNAGLVVKKQFSGLPDHPELVGVTYAVSPGAYYITTTGTKPFVVYSYGFQASSNDGTLGDYSGNDFFYSYALPVGFRVLTGDTGSLSITVDTLCDRWHVCVHDGRLTNPGIQSLVLLDDPNGDFTRPGRQYYNVRFDSKLDPDNTRTIDLPGTDTTLCVDVFVTDLSDSAYAPVYIVDRAGNDYVLDLRLSPSGLHRTVVGVDASESKDSLLVLVSRGVKQDTCVFLTLKNSGRPGFKPITLTDIRLLHTNRGFRLGSMPSFPRILNSGDSIRISVCYLAADTMTHSDSLLLSTSCVTTHLVLRGESIQPKIFATDLDYGTVAIHTTSCQIGYVRNVGSDSFTLLGMHIPDTNSFALLVDTSKLFPFPLKPGQSLLTTFCFHPQGTGADTATVEWITSIAGDYHNSTKAWTGLRGVGTDPSGVPTATGEKVGEMSVSVRQEALMVHLPAALSRGSVQFELFDILGRTVAKWPARERSEPGSEVRLSLPNLESGIYILRATSGLTTASAKLVR